LPFVGGKEFLFFRFIFNVADSAITVGVILLLLFYRNTLAYSLLSKKEREKHDSEKMAKAKADSQVAVKVKAEANTQANSEVLVNENRNANTNVKASEK
jgi:hypothetical protein